MTHLVPSDSDPVLYILGCVVFGIEGGKLQSEIQAKFSLMPILVNKVLSKHIYAHSFIYCICWLSCCNNRVTKSAMFTILVLF